MSGYDSLLGIPPDAQHMQQASTLHLGVVRDVKDPEMRGRVRVECTTLNHEGKENWMNWCEVIGLPVSTINQQGDFGIWWPMMPGTSVYVGFKDGDYLQPYCVPGPAWSQDAKPKQEMLPKEAKNISDKDVRKGTRVRELKSESGHTILMDDNGKSELMALLDWVGTGTVWMSPGKKEDDQEKPKEESKPRKGEKRQTRNVFAKTSKKPSEIIQGGVQIVAQFDLNHQGIITIAQDDAGQVAIFASKDGSAMDAYAVFDASKPATVIGAGDVQIQVRGDKGHIAVTRQIITEQEPIDFSEWYDAVSQALEQRMKGFD